MSRQDTKIKGEFTLSELHNGRANRHDLFAPVWQYDDMIEMACTWCLICGHLVIPFSCKNDLYNKNSNQG